MFHAEEERPISCDLPSHVELEITYTEPGVKGDTATNSLKPATVDTGAEVRVPLFIDTGDWIKVDTRTVITQSASKSKPSQASGTTMSNPKERRLKRSSNSETSS